MHENGMSGLKVAIRYALPACRLGFCGPKDSANRQILLDFVGGNESLGERARQIVEQFREMVAYLRLIARCNRISDPLDLRVVKALWVGNSLLDRVGFIELRRLVTRDFVSAGLISDSEARLRVARLRHGMVPHHSLVALVLDSVAGVPLQGAARELCRVGWGKVLGVSGGTVKAQSRRIDFGNRALGRDFDHSPKVDPHFFSHPPRLGEWVSYHFGMVCETLREDEVRSLESYTLKNLALSQS
jgi:hypothetical protein